MKLYVVDSRQKTCGTRTDGRHIGIRETDYSSRSEFMGGIANSCGILSLMVIYLCLNLLLSFHNTVCRVMYRKRPFLTTSKDSLKK